ncbi:MAG: efflux transporter periplasmic adaptor subunit, partial [Sediminibacterium sp.]
MQKIINVLFLTATLTLASCGSKTEDGSLAGKKAELEKLKKEQVSMGDKIKTLEKEIAKLDTSAMKEDVAKLVGTSIVVTQNFSHYIDLQGRVDAENISYISPRLGGGQVRSLYVKR